MINVFVRYDPIRSHKICAKKEPENDFLIKTYIRTGDWIEVIGRSSKKHQTHFQWCLNFYDYMDIIFFFWNEIIYHL